MCNGVGEPVIYRSFSESFQPFELYFNLTSGVPGKIDQTLSFDLYVLLLHISYEIKHNERLTNSMVTRSSVSAGGYVV